MYLYHYNKKFLLLKKKTLKNKKQTKKITKEKQNNDFPKQIGENVENYLCMKKN